MSAQIGNSEFRLRLPNPSARVTGILESLQQDAEKDVLFYRDIFLGKPHQNYLAIDSPRGPLAVSLIKDGKSYKAIVRSGQGNERFSADESEVPISWWRSLFDLGPSPVSIFGTLSYTIPHSSLTQVKNHDLPSDLLAMEERQIIRSYKFGVLYLAPGQTTEGQAISNQHETASENYKKFLKFLGEEIDLANWKGYRGGLDTSGRDLTGKTSVYTKWQSYEIMFHISTLLPFKADDMQRIERKRHIGNDICVLVFQDSDEPFQLASVLSRQNHIYIIVRPDGPNNYRLCMAHKRGVPDFLPELPEPPVISNDPISRDYLLHLLVNGERASYLSPSFAPKLARTRSILVSDIAIKYLSEK